MNKNRIQYNNWVVKLIIINVAVFLIQSTVDSSMGNLAIKYLGLTPALVIKKGFVWQIFSYMFLHGNFIHLFFNMYALLMFGIPIEQAWGSRQFLKYYFYTGIGAGITIFHTQLFHSGRDIGICPHYRGIRGDLRSTGGLRFSFSGQPHSYLFRHPSQGQIPGGPLRRRYPLGVIKLRRKRRHIPTPGTWEAWSADWPIFSIREGSGNPSAPGPSRRNSP